MLQKNILLKKMYQDKGIITTKKALELGINKDVLKELVQKKEIIKIANGLYGFPNEDIDEYIYFIHRVPKGVFSHETAAYLHGLSTRMPLVYVMTVETGDNVTRVKKIKNNIIFKYCNKKYHNIGKITIKNIFGREITVYDKERTILDLIKDKDRIDAEVFSESIKAYFNSKDKNLLKLTKYAIRMNMEKNIKIYTELLL